MPDLARTYLGLATVGLLQFMSLLSLLRLYFSNPGYVKDYFKSRKLESTPDFDSLKFEVFRKEDLVQISGSGGEA